MGAVKHTELSDVKISVGKFEMSLPNNVLWAPGRTQILHNSLLYAAREDALFAYLCAKHIIIVVFCIS